MESLLNKDLTVSTSKTAPRSTVCPAKSFLFSKGLGPVGAWGRSLQLDWRSHEKVSSPRTMFQALWLPRVVRNVVCGFWIFTINWKESAFKQLVLWLLKGQDHICILDMSEVLFMGVPLVSENRNHHKVSVIHVAACSLHTIFDSWFCILLLTLSLHCKWCRKQMLDKIPKSLIDFCVFFFPF